MTLKEAINIIENDVQCRESIMTTQCCQSCLDCEYHTTFKNLAEAHKVILNFFLTKAREQE